MKYVIQKNSYLNQNVCQKNSYLKQNPNNFCLLAWRLVMGNSLIRICREINLYMIVFLQPSVSG